MRTRIFDLRRRGTLHAASAALVVFCLLAICLAARPLAWVLLRQAIRWEFPHVRQLSTAELAAWLRDPARPAPLLLDARTPEEYSVSHLPNARRIDFSSPDAIQQLPAIPKDTAVVVYCSVGYRSSIFATRLREAGFTNVANLEGSLFQWVSEKRPLADGASQVHPYNARWGLLLTSAARYEEPVPTRSTPPQ